jgi:hypothetical protein
VLPPGPLDWLGRYTKNAVDDYYHRLVELHGPAGAKQILREWLIHQGQPLPEMSLEEYRRELERRLLEVLDRAGIFVARSPFGSAVVSAGYGSNLGVPGTEHVGAGTCCLVADLPLQEGSDSVSGAR